MKIPTLPLVLALCAALFAGCENQKMASPKRSVAFRGAPEEPKEDAAVRPDRMMIWTASMCIEVTNVRAKTEEAVAITKKRGGFVEQKSDEEESSASLKLRVPSAALQRVMAELEPLGKVTARRIEAEDVTEQYVDVDARLKNKLALRDRLKQLLEQAKNVQDIVAIEKELNQVQADIDSMQAQIKSLKGQADYATLHLTLERKTILGPLGYVFKGLWWGVKKLFVIRD